ncbi:uncharacterized protein LOC128712921 [Anopheles marshallii]|uniref:uncharacterized protein LOC128712921 n=1 Tax=Anopheles marshallii TaxID=1521116 RepID=UPI00237B8F4E|nr:uncharacterized protein LOC128712921 [Anopheles marshallii]
MDTPENLNVLAPKKRETLQSFRQRALIKDDDVIAGLAECPYEQQDTNFSRESSVSRSQSTCEQGDLIDADDSISDDLDLTDDMEERSDTPVPDTGMHNASNESSGTPLNPMPPSRRSSVPPIDGLSQHESARKPYDRTNSNGNGLCTIGLIAAIVIVVIASISRQCQPYSSGNVTPIKQPSSTCEAIFKLEERYTTIDENLWDLLNVVVHRATTHDKKPQPGTILFLHYGPTVILDGFIHSVSNITASCFGGSEPITLVGKYFKQPDFQEDYGVIVSQQKEALLKHGVMVVRNFEDVPALAAQAFHTICDTEEPLVHRAVIYLTLDMLKASNVSKPPSEQSATAEAEKLLRELWKDSMGPAFLEPLITRLTENVYRIV